MTIKPGRALNQERKVLLDEAESVAHMGSWKWTESNNELVWSEGLHKIFNKKPNEVISWNTFLENVLPEDVLLVKNCLHEAKNNKHGSSIDYRITIDGEVHYLSLTVKPHEQLHKDILGAVIDITERKEYEKKLQNLNVDQSKIIQELDEKEKKYRLLFERSIDPIFLATQKLALLDINHSFLSLFGYSKPLRKTLTVKNIFTRKEDYAYFFDTLKKNEQVKDFEVSLITKTGEEKTCIINCVFTPDQPADFGCYHGIIHDLSLRKKAETDMILAERLSLTGKIARTIAHEVRNPLTNLNLALDQLRSDESFNTESTTEYIEIIERNANRIEQLVGEMLNSSRPKQLNLKLTEVSDLLNDTVKLAVDRIQLNGIKLVTTYQEKLPRILIDKEKIQVALLNIIINAIEASEPGKGILKIDAHLKNKILTVSIMDKGKGIPVADVAKLFDPFFTGKESGMGLGLTSTKNILNSHSVNIEVKSKVNVGTTFYIHFKLAE